MIRQPPTGSHFAWAAVEWYDCFSVSFSSLVYLVNVGPIVSVVADDVAIKHVSD